MSFLAMDDPGHLGFARWSRRGSPHVEFGNWSHRDRASSPQHDAGCRAEHESFDYIDEFAGKLPMDVISELVGVPEDRRTCAPWPTR
jgi:hypothetical protein